jgi:protein-tyrosine phosphatase
MVKVLFVCLGNICRSPLAEGVLRHRAGVLGEKGEGILVDSAGTSGWHLGEAPDTRAQEAAKRRGFDISALRSRQLVPADFETFDHILVMDRQNLIDAEAIRPEGAGGLLRLLLEEREVPDPYWGGDSHFDSVIDLIEEGIEELLAEIGAEAQPS